MTLLLHTYETLHSGRPEPRNNICTLPVSGVHPLSVSFQLRYGCEKSLVLERKELTLSDVPEKSWL